ncbi:MAG: serine/threonine-protein kinase [Verrucomicrobiota bacterium]
MDHPDPLDLLKIGMGELDPPLIEFPGYFVEGSLGRGGMGMVFLAQSETSSEDVAIKVLAPELTTDPIATARFEREIATLEKLEHPNLVSIVGRGTTATNSPFLVMEYLAGGDLAGLMEKGPIPLADLSRIIRAVADALEYLHAQDLLHRDLKPSNILFGESHDEIKLADFGLAKFTSDSTNSLSLTRTGAAVGTSHYLAPEILANPKALSPAADWFGLGVIFYQGLTGRLPVGNFEPPSVFGDFSPSIDRFVQRALHSDPAQRFSAAAEWNEEFEKALNPPSKIGRRVAIASGSLICLGAVASWLGWKNWPRKPLESSRFERFESYPWLAKSVWNDINPVEFPDRDFVAQASAHLMAHSFQNNETLAFPGRSLSLQTGSSLHIGGQKARVQIDRLLLDGGTLTSDPFHSLPEGRFDILRGWIANYPERYNPSKQQSSPILQGRIEVRRPSVLATGPAGVWPLRIEAEITGPAPILVAQSFIDEPIRLGRSNPDFSGGWCILGSVIAEAGDALGSGPVIVRRRTLSIMGDSKLGPTVIEGSGVIRIIGATQFESLTIDGEAIPPGSYEAGFNDYRNHFISENAFEVLGVGGPTLDLLNPKPDSAAAGPPIRAKESGRWDLDATWDGPVPIENPNAAYVASEGIAVRGTPFNRGIELFGGHSLTLETGSSLELSCS